MFKTIAMKRKCDVCNKEYEADDRNIKRGWGLCCSKSCAATKRERSRPDYDPHKVMLNNRKREGWLLHQEYLIDHPYPYSYEGADDDQWGDCDLGIHD